MTEEATPSFREALGVWTRVAINSFGGPAGQIAVMHRLLVEDRRWVSEERFLHALNYCMLLPGPEAQQLAVYIGWLKHGVRGGLAAGTLFILPGFLSILALSYLYILGGDWAPVAILFGALPAAVVALVVAALFKLAPKALRSTRGWALAVVAFVALFAFAVPFPIVVLGAAFVGWLGRGSVKAQPEVATANARPSRAATVRTFAKGLAIWLVPLALMAAVLGQGHVLVQVGVYFSKLAMLTFGGAYAALAWVAQEAVAQQAWVTPAEMVHALGMAETTPGPLIQSVQFVGFMAAWRDTAPFGPLTAAFLGSLVATWATFAPCFLWIFAGAPWIEHLRRATALTATLQGITAAVVGVVANLAAWYAVQALFDETTPLAAGPLGLVLPVWSTIDLPAIMTAIVLTVLLVRRRLGPLGAIGAAIVVLGGWRLLVG